MSAGLQELAHDLLEASGELVKCISGGDYNRALRCRRRLDKIAGEAARFASVTKPPAAVLTAYRTALAEANRMLAEARLKARLERDRIGRAMRHCGSVKKWVESNRNTF